MLVASEARGDRFVATRSEKLVERAHTVEVRVGRGEVTLVAERIVHNGGPRHDQATFHIDLPPGAVATGLRTLATLNGKPHWFDGELLEAQLAARRYRELTGIGGYHPKDPALLSWRTQRHLALQVFPCPPGEDKAVEYTLKLPTRYRDGRERVTLSAMGTRAVPPRARVRAVDERDELFLDGEPLASGGAITLDRELELSLRPAQAPELDGALAVVPFAEHRALLHYRVTTSPQLSLIPRGAHVVVLLDASRSFTEDQAAASVAAARSYLGHFAGTGARVALITFDRHVHTRGGFVGVDQAIADLDGLTLERKNGSALDGALERARALLSDAPAAAAKRVVLLTDLRTRSALRPRDVEKTLGGDAVLHIGVLHGGPPRVLRDDADAWARVPRRTGGVLWRGMASGDADHRPAMHRAFEEWARPLRVDRLAVTVPGVAADALAHPSKLDEGQGIETLHLASRASPWVRVTGEVWARPVKKLMSPTHEENRRWAGLVFGSHLLEALTEKEMMPLALYGRAVSPVSSYLAIEPGVRPSTEGLEHGAGFGRLSGSHRTRAPSVRMGASSATEAFDKQGFLRDALAAAWRRCGGGVRVATLSIETTGREIVDARLEQLSSPAEASATSCMLDAAWALDLPSGFRDHFAAYRVEV
jgi:hypothetical protein